ncbi:hypothetical protein C0995_004110 [Termitomyces sp. Mi166|nr:hypothetical protein C0995_004110 [Termitomyces sp. Mi166\
MHSGGPGPDDCLAPGTIPGKTARGVAAGAAIGSLVAGLVIGGVLAFAFQRRQDRLRKGMPGSYPSVPPPDYYNERPLPAIPFNLSLRLPVWLRGLMSRVSKNGESGRGDDNLWPFTPPRPRVTLVEPKASAHPPVPVAIVRDDLQNRRSAYSEPIAIAPESPPSYDPTSHLKAATS